MSNPNFTSLVATTIKNYRKQLTDNITGHNILWFMTNQHGGIVEDEGGTSIVEPLLIGRNSTVRSYKGYDLLDTTPQEGITAAEFDWKQIAGTLSISGEEKFKNSSKSKVISLLDAKTKQLEISMELEMNRQLQGDGTGNGGKDLTGLALQVEDGAAWSIVGGIDSNAFPYWRNQWIGGTATFASAGLGRARTLYNSASRGKDKPELLISDQYLFEQYEALLVPNERFTDMSLGDAGFQNLMFKNTPWVFDDDMPFEDLATDEHQLLMLNFKYMKFIIGKGKNFSVTPMMRPENQDAELQHILLYGNLTQSNRARQGRLTDLT